MYTNSPLALKYMAYFIKNCMDRKKNWDSIEFVNYLISKNYSKRVASNYASRINRIEKELDVDIVKMVANKEKYTMLLTQIAKYSNASSKTKGQLYSIGGTLRAALRRFTEFNLGVIPDDYPRAYKLGVRITIQNTSKDLRK